MNFRKQKLESQIRKLISEILVTEIKDPRIGFITVTRVKLSKDYSYADVFVSVMGDESSKNKTLKGLISAKGYIQYRVGKSIRMRTLPQIRFHIDDSIEYGTHMVDLLEKLEKENKKDQTDDEQKDVNQED